MDLSQIEIDFSNPRTKRDLTHLGAIHGWVEHCFLAEIAQSVRRIPRISGDVAWPIHL